MNKKTDVPSGTKEKKKKNNSTAFEGQDLMACVDEVTLSRSNVLIRGWYASSEEALLTVFDASGKPMESEVQLSGRLDVLRVYPDLNPDDIKGFTLSVRDNGEKALTLKVTAENITRALTVTVRGGIKSRAERMYRVLQLTKRDRKEYGVFGAFKKGWNQEHGIIPNPYAKWRKAHLVSQAELAAQRNKKFDIEPKFSFVIPLYKTPVNYLTELVDSVKNQTYDNWEICFSDGSGQDSPLTDVLKGMNESDPRIRYVQSPVNLQISENTNKALEIAEGDYIVFSDHDDTLASDALYECVKLINEYPDTQMIYTDEDKVSMDGKEYFEPAFKPDFNIDLLRSCNYICHLCIVSRNLYEQVGGLNGEFDGAQDFDFVIRCAEATDKIRHIPKVLYHWRSHMDSTAGNPISKTYAFKAGTRVVAAHYDRLGWDNVTANETVHLGITRSIYGIKGEPSVSVIVYGDDEAARMSCIESVKASDTDVLEIITTDETLSLAKAVNEAALKASGDYLLIVSDSIEFTDRGCIRELLGPCQREDIAVTGGRLKFDNEHLSSVGVIAGLKGSAASLYEGAPYGDVGYTATIVKQQDRMAVSPRMMMTSAETFKKLGGFDESYTGLLSAVDYCLKAGSRIINSKVYYNAYAEAVDHSPLTDNGIMLPVFVSDRNSSTYNSLMEDDAALFNDRWAELIKKGDIYYHPNLSLKSAVCDLK